MPTLDDIAKELGITKGTVSKALSGAPDISEATRTKILDTAIEMGYKRVVRKRKGKLAIFIENMEWEKADDFGHNLLAGFRKMAEPAGYSVDIIPLSLQMEEEISYDTYMFKHDYKGGFFLGLTFQDLWLRELQTCQTPTVLYDFKITDNPVIAMVSVDNREGILSAVKQLTELGHSKIGYLSSDLGNYVYRERYNAYLQAVEQHGLELGEEYARHAYLTTEILTTHLPALLEKGCTAFACSHDLLAHSVMRHCIELGLKVPEDISIIGFDDIPLCQYCVPPLTTIRQDRTELGKSAFFALNSIFNKVSVSSLQLHPQLIVRGSIGPLGSTK